MASLTAPPATAVVVLTVVPTTAPVVPTTALPTATAAHQLVSSAYLTFPTYSGPWFRAVTDIDHFWGAQLADGTVLDIAQIQQQVEAIALPHTYTFDQGALVFRTAISQTDAEDLYDALQETESQFFRRTTHLDPVAGDANDVLTLVIYGSPDEYALYQPFLYGLSTNNGGIYIEGWGTLFTYDRTPAQSIYTLEELLRHEHTHFLDGRYLVQGGWYESGGLYEGGRLDTWGEGLAEYLEPLVDLALGHEHAALVVPRVEGHGVGGPVELRERGLGGGETIVGILDG